MFHPLLLLAVALGAPSAGGLRSADDAAPLLVVKNADGKETRFSADAWAKLPHQKLRAKGPHSGTTFEYEGVLLPDVLKSAGVTFGKDLKGPRLAAYVLAEAKDGYRVVYSIGEVDPDTGNIQILVADKKDGNVLTGTEGTIRLVVPQDKRPARWIRMVTVLRSPAPTRKGSAVTNGRVDGPVFVLAGLAALTKQSQAEMPLDRQPAPAEEFFC